MSDQRAGDTSDCGMSLSLVWRSEGAAVDPVKALNPQALSSPDPFVRAAAELQARADAQNIASANLELVTLNKVAARRAADGTTPRSDRGGPPLLLELDPICRNGQGDDEMAVLAPSGRWTQPAWLAAGPSGAAGAVLPAMERTWGAKGGSIRATVFDASRAGTADQPPADVMDDQAAATLVGLSEDSASDDEVVFLHFGGASAGGFGSGFSGFPAGSGLEAVQPLRLTPRAAPATTDPITGSLAPLDPGALAPAAASAAPEPATWAMMLLGLGGLGVFLRRPGARRPAILA